MKTVFVCAKGNMFRHNGEEYDAIVEVEDCPTMETIGRSSEHVRNEIMRLHAEQVKAGEAAPKVSVQLDAAAPFNAMLMDFRIIMRKQFGIVIELPYLPEGYGQEVGDKETKELLERIGYTA